MKLMKHKGIVGWLAIFTLLTFLVTPAIGQSLRSISDYGVKVITALSEDPAIVMAAQKGSALDENSAASLKLRAALKGKTEALFAFVMNKDGKVVAAGSNIGEQDFTKEAVFTLPIKYGKGSLSLSKPISVYYYSLPVVSDKETVGVIAVAVSAENLLK
jgi:C4-dicarboxylate-specific signal transduction histidine kinase